MIRILSDNPASKGRLFEELTKEMLQKLGFERIQLRCRAIGAEYDVEATDSLTKQEIIGECKALATPLPSEHLLKWLGKYTLRCSENPNLVAIFFTLSPLSSEARTLYREIRKSHERFVVHTPEDIMNMLEEKEMVVSAKLVEERVRKKLPDSVLRNRFLAYTGQGMFWVQIFSQSRGSIALTLLDSKGNFVSEEMGKEILQYDAEFADTPFLDFSGDAPKKYLPPEGLTSKIVKPAKGIGWFDYRYPSPPEYFVGRVEERKRFADFIDQIRRGKTSCRGVVVSGPSGIGKSSFVLKLEDLVKDNNCLYVPIDCRGCAGPDFVGIIVNTLKEMSLRISPKKEQLRGIDRNTSLMENPDNDVSVLADQINAILAAKKSFAIIFFDQFEYLIQYPMTVDQIKNLLLYLMSSDSRIILGFAVKSDFTIDFSSFPFDAWNVIREQSYSVRLEDLELTDVNRLIRQMQNELSSKIKPSSLRNVIEFSGKKPWILKRVCSYLLQAQKMGKLSEIIRSGLNLDQLFKEDIDQLTEDELTVVRAIAKSGPVDSESLSCPFGVERTRKILSSLATKRLVVHIGSNYDLYHEQFRKYIIETMLAREEQLQVQIDLYIRMLQALAKERKFRVIPSILEILHRLFVKNKSSYRIHEVVQVLDVANVIEPLGYKYLELKARSLAKEGLHKKSQIAYYDAVNALVVQSQRGYRISILERGDMTHLGSSTKIPYLVGELRRIRLDCGDIEGAKRAERFGELLLKKHKSEHALIEELSKVIAEGQDDTILGLTADILGKDVDSLRAYVKLLRESSPEKIVGMLIGIFPSSSDVDLVRGCLPDVVQGKLSRGFQRIAKDDRKKKATRNNALRWLAKLDPDSFVQLSKREDLRLSVMRNIRAMETIPANSIDYLLNMLLKLPPANVNDREKEEILHDFCVVWDDVAPYIPLVRLRKVIAHLSRLYDRDEQSINLRWYVALFAESLVNSKTNLPSQSIDLLLKLASSEKATVRNKAATMIETVLSTSTLTSEKRKTLRSQLKSLSRQQTKS